MYYAIPLNYFFQVITHAASMCQLTISETGPDGISKLIGGSITNYIINIILGYNDNSKNNQ